MIDSVRTTLSTDFAILYVSQDAGDFPGNFATSGRGWVSAYCGTKYATLDVTVERWDGRPAPVAGWEDVDEVPFEAIPDGPGLEVAGFEGTGVRLGAVGLERARVLIHARGRHRYGYSDFADEGLEPEEWLFQFFPDPDDLDAMAGGPRSIAKREVHEPQTMAAWEVALGWARAGWHHYLYQTPGFRELQLAVHHQEGPTSRDHLLEQALPWIAERRIEAWSSSDPADIPLIPHEGTPLVRQAGPPESWYESQEQERVRQRGRLDRVAEMARTKRLEVLGDFLDALTRLGVLLAEDGDGGTVLTPNARPTAAALVANNPDDRRGGYREENDYSNFRSIAENLEHLVRWAPGRRLRATAEQIAARLGVTVYEVQGGLELQQHLRKLQVQKVDADNPEQEALEVWIPDS
ncbi:hypothetical protein GCM10023225_24170 [Kineococcus glutinatus]|uniref:Uncharacterized protein n=2 Tax=Kineococcus glutinatus TaxID=1070872 RepID=A0ABP9I0I3_9ACTN